MSSAQNPFGLHSVTPILIAEELETLTKFLVHVFGAEPRGPPQLSEDGRVRHFEVKIGDSVIMMSQPAKGDAPRLSSLYVYVPNAEATYKRALLMGASSVQEPKLLPHGDRLCGVKDSLGNFWWIVTHVG